MIGALQSVGSARVAAMRPVAPAPGDEPWEDGMQVEAVMQPEQVAAAPARVDEPASVTDSDAGERNPSRFAAISQEIAAQRVAAPAAVLPHFAPPALAATGGNASVSTGFDRTPAQTPVGASFASPLERALRTNASV